MVAGTVITVLVALAGATGIYAYRNLTYDRAVPGLVREAGFAERQATLPDGSVITYGEGPSGGVPLLLIHGQMVSWTDYARVLSGLTGRYHVYAVDCYGHGGSSKDPRLYTATAQGEALAWFIEHVIGQPAVVSGHSSGGLLTTWLAANSPPNVLGVLIEDAPFFATEAGRREHTYAWLDGFKPIHDFLGEPGNTGWTRYWLHHNYLRTLWGADGWARLVQGPAEAQLDARPGRLPRLWYLPASMNRSFDLTACLQDGTGDYDLRFGDTFYDGSWFAGFDQAGALACVRVPSVLLHTKVSLDANQVLLGAMSAEDAHRADELLADNELVDGIDSGHDIHDEKPGLFTAALIGLLDRLQI